MHKSTFDYIWERNIKPMIDLCYSNLDFSFKEQTNCRIRDLKIYKNELEKLYKRKREWLKTEYLPHNSEPKLDFHKLGAIICRCIIGNKPIVFDESRAQEFLQAKHNEDISNDDKLQWEIDNIYVNYKVAFLVCEGIAFDDLIYWTKTKIEECESEEKTYYYNNMLEFLTKTGCMEEYIRSPKHDGFISSMIVALMKTDLLTRDFDYLFLSAGIYQWQEYTKRCILESLMCSDECKNNIDALMGKTTVEF